MKKEYTGFKDDNGVKIYVGDTLKSEWNYDVVVFRDDDGSYSGKLVCEPDHSCANIPYALNNGKGYVHSRRVVTAKAKRRE